MGMSPNLLSFMRRLASGETVSVSLSVEVSQREIQIAAVLWHAGLHGQTYWTDDAAEVLSDNMEDGEDFLFVHDTTLGMHYL